MSLYGYYVEATKRMGKPSWQHVKDEWDEVVEIIGEQRLKTLQDMSKEELREETEDVFHSLFRYMGLPNRLVWILANNTAKKHALRMQDRDCPRSERNCKNSEEKCCWRKN